MTAPAWMPLYVADYLADTGHLSTLEHGAYMLLIMHYWQNGGLPSEDDKLSRICRMTGQQWRRIRASLADFFDANWRHARIDSEIAHAAKITSKRKEAGKAGASVRYGKCLANAIAEPEQTHRPTPSPPPIPKEDPSLRSGERASTSEALPLSEALGFYNEIAEAVGWSLATKLTPARRTSLRARLAEHGGLDGWRTLMARARASPFLTGKTPRANGHKNWRPDFDFFTSQQHLMKLSEGGYDDPGGGDAIADDDAFWARLGEQAPHGQH